MTSPDALRHDFTERIEPHGAALVRYLRRLCDAPQNAPDVLQTALVRAFAAHARFDPEASFKAWIYRFATNEAFNDNRRRRHRRREAPLDPELVAGFVEGPLDVDAELAYERVLADPDAVLARLEEPLARALCELSSRVRAAFLLRSLAEMSCKEIADTLGVPKGTVVSWLFRARARLRLALADWARERGLERGAERGLEGDPR